MAEFHYRHVRRTEERDCPPCPTQPKCSCKHNCSSGNPFVLFLLVMAYIVTFIVCVAFYGWWGILFGWLGCCAVYLVAKMILGDAIPE